MSRNQKIATLVKVIQESTNYSNLPFCFALAFHTFLLLQSSSMIFDSGFVSINSQDQSIIFQILDKFLAVTHLFDIFDPSQPTALICIFFMLAIAFLGSMIFLFFYISFHYVNGKKPISLLLKIFRIGNFLHSHMLFYLIHFFTVKLMFSFNDCVGELNPSYYCQGWCLALSLLCFLVNIAWAFFQTIFFQMQTEENSLATKNNHFALSSLIQKSSCLFLAYLSKDTQYIAVFLNLIFELTNTFLIHKSLLFYNIRILRLTVVINAVNVTLAAFMIPVALESNVNITGVAWLMVTFLFVKLVLVRFNLTLERIIRLEFSNPAEAIHFPILFDEYAEKYSVVQWQQRLQKKGSFYFFGLVNAETNFEEKIGNEDTLNQLKGQLYHELINKYNHLLSKNPKNTLLTLSMARIYIEHLGDAPHAVKLLAKLGKENTTFLFKLALNSANGKLEKFLKKKTHSQKFREEWTYFLTNQKQMTIIKGEIQKEITEHVNFWNQLNGDKVHAKQLALKALKIENLSRRIQKIWDENSAYLIAGFPTARLMYGVYLDLIRGYSHLGLTLIKTGREVLLSKKESNYLGNMLTDKSAIITASIEPDKIGQVLDCSISVNNIFKIQRENLIGSSINIVLPKILAEKHDLIIKKFVKEFRYNLDSQRESYAKTVDGEYFPIELCLRVSPSIQNGLSVMAFIQKSPVNNPLIILDSYGKILEYSKELQTLLNLKERSENLNINRLCPEMLKYIQATNILHFSKHFEENFAKPQEEMVEFDASSAGTSPMISPVASHLLNKGASTALEDKLFNSRRLSSQRELLSPKIPKSMLASAIKSNWEKSLLTNSIDSFRRNSRNHSLGLSIASEGAEKLCQEIKEGRKFSFYPFRNKSSKKGSTLEFMAQLDSIVVGGEFYIVVKLRKVASTSSRKSVKASALLPSKELNQSLHHSLHQSQGFPEAFPTEDEYNETRKSIENSRSAERVNTSKVEDQDEHEDAVKVVVINNKVEDKNSENFNNKESSESFEDLEAEKIGTSNLQVNPQRSETNPSSVRDTKRKNQTVVKQLKEVFSRKQSQVVSKVSSRVVYLTTLILCILFSINLFFAQSSLREIESDVVLLDAVDNRLYKSVVAWQGLLTIYLIAVGIRPSTSTNALYQSALKTYARDMSSSNQLLSLNLSLSDQNIIRGFYDKAITLWNPETGHYYISEYMDSFAASQTLYQNYIYVSTYSDALLSLAGDTTALFAINNTVNDYLLKAEDDTQQVEGVVDKSVQTNITLLKVFLIIQILFLGGIVLFVGFSIRKVSLSHENMLRALSKIKSHTIEDRVNLIQRVSTYFSTDLDTQKWYRIPVQESGKRKKTVKNDEMAAKQKLSRHTGIKDIVLCLLRSSVFVIIYVGVLVTVCSLNFLHSIQDFNGLKSINNKLTVTHKLGTNIATLLPTYYFQTIFQNDTTYKIRNDVPQIQLLQNLDLLRNANQMLLSVLADSDGVISDPVIIDALNKNICDKLTSSNKNCLNETNNNSFGLLGLNLKYYDGCNTLMNNYLLNPTRDNAEDIYNSLTVYTTNLPIVLRRSYEYLTTYFLNTFHEVTSEKIENTYTFFIILIVINVVGTFTIQIFTISKLEKYDIACRRVIQLVPLSIIQDNRIMNFYVKKVYSSELGNVLRFL